MPNPLFYTLIEQVAANVRAHSDIDASKVELGRGETLQINQFPFIAISLGDDSPLSSTGPQNLNFIDWNVGVDIEIYTEAQKEENLDLEFLNLRAAIHKAIMQNETLGLPFVSFAIPDGATEPTYTDEAELRIAIYKLMFTFRCRTSVTDLTTL